MKIKKGDTVTIIAGNDKGKTGTVLEFMREAKKVLVEGINMKTHFMKQTDTNKKGQGITVKKPAPMDMSNVKVTSAK
jgi:large subunit ribosomal protein L24